MSTLFACVLGVLLVAGDDVPDNEVQTYALKEATSVGGQIHTKLHLVIRGKIRAGDKEEELAGQALLEYSERSLELGKDGLSKKVARYYEDARAKFVVGTTGDPRRLRPQVRFVVGERSENNFEIWSPGGPFRSDELELIEDTVDTTRLPGLLPRDAVAVGDTWEPDPKIILAICDLDNYIDSKVDAKLTSVENGKANISIAGYVNGLALSTEVKQKIEGTMVYDLQTKCLEQVTLAQADNRGPSPVSPAGSFQVKLSIDRTRKESEKLSDAVLAGVTLVPNPASKLILFEEPEGHYRFYHDRDWHVTMLNANKVVLRRLSGGQFIAQLNVTVMNGPRGGSAVTPNQLRQMIESEAGVTIDEVLQVNDLPTDGTFDLRLLSASGKSGEIPLRQKHYIATAKSGRQVVFSFSFEPQHEAALGTMDLSMVTSVEFTNQTAGNASPIKK